MADSFAHLHVHTEYSMLDGASRVDEAVAAAAADGQPAMAITDHGNMYGVLDFYRGCKDAGINPIIGTEMYLAHESRLERPSRRGKSDDSGGDVGGGRKLYYHAIMMAENNVGYQNLIQLSSKAYLEGYHYKPRCMMPGQEILTSEGVKPVEDIRVGDIVLTHKGRLRPVTQVMSRHHDGTVYGVELNNRYNRVTWLTDEHPVLVRTAAGDVRWVPVDQITAGRTRPSESIDTWASFACLPKIHVEEPLQAVPTADWIGDEWEYQGEYFTQSVPRRRIGPTRKYGWLPDELELDYDSGFFFGLFLAEGWVSGAEVCFAFHEDEFDLIAHVCRFIKDFTDREASVRGRPDRPDYHGVTVAVSSPALSSLMRNLCGSGAPNKRLPEFAFDADLDFQRGLFDGVLAGDGADHGDHWILAQTSPHLAWQMRMLGATFADSFPSVAQRHDGNPNHAPQFRSNFAKPHWCAHRKVLVDDDYVYRPISAVNTKHYAGPVYNFEVADDHSYVSDFAMHNCDWDLMAEHAEGIIATSGCLGGHVLQSLMQGQEDAALEHAARFQDIFGRDNFFIELQDQGIPEQRQTNPQLLEIAKKIQAPILATNDSHYTHQHGAEAHDALLCVQTGSLLSDTDRFKFHGDGHYIKSAGEMRRLFAEVPEACDNTLWIAERCNVEIEFGQPQLPEFPLPAGFATDTEYLRHLTYEGAHKRWGEHLPAAVVERLDYELGVIDSMGFSAYFLITWDLIKHARDNDIRVGPGRGSAAGCAVAYTLWITDLDPIKYDLLFERFLNPSRISMPDIDMDFDTRYRDEMIRYAAEMYGRDCVAQIVTFSQIKARAAVRDAARVLGYPYAVGDKVAKAMPPLIMGRDTPLKYCFEQHPKYLDGYKSAGELRDMVSSDGDIARVVDVAKGLEGLRRQDGIHAAAVVITNEPLTEYLPIQRKPEAGKPIEESPVVTQYEMHGVEDLGLLKMDFLGLRNLDVISDCLELLRQTKQLDIDIDAVALDDAPTFELLKRGDTIGVFQLESSPMRALIRSLAPDSFDDVAALVALYRPGPMAANMHNDYADRKNGRKPVEFIHPDAEELLGDTYGLMIYQESVMRMAQKFAGYSLAEADSLRKAMGKKIREAMEKERQKFTDGVVANGYEHSLAVEMFDIIAQFADYAFNKSHSYGYGYVAYQIAYLKANHPVEYLAALLTSVKSRLESAAVYLNECRLMGITVEVPDINRSESDFTPVPNLDWVSGADDTKLTPGDIVFGLSAIRNVGEGFVEKVLAARDQDGPYESFVDFVERVDLEALNKRTIESLIKGGAFDSLGHPRKGLLQVYEQIIDLTVQRRKEHEMGVMSLFGALDDGPSFDERPAVPDVEFDKMPRLANEKEMLGLYISDHPLLGFEAQVRRKADTGVAGLADTPDGAIVKVGGVITNLQRKWTRKGDLMAVFELEDLEGSVEVMVFPRTMQEHGPKLQDDAIVLIRGRTENGDDLPKLFAQDIEIVEDLSDNAPVKLLLSLENQRPECIVELKSILSAHPGDAPVELHLSSRQVLRLPDEFAVDNANGVVAELRVAFGPDAILV